MGGSSSKAERKLTVDNENAIQVSQEVLDRLQEQLQNKPPAPQQPAPQRFHSQPTPEFHTQELVRQYAEEEAYWAQRIENLKRAHARINAGMDKEYQKTLNEANELFNSVKNYKAVSRVVPCQEEKAKVLKCYDSNPSQTLLCSVLVNQFNDCVCRSREAAISATS